MKSAHRRFSKDFCSHQGSCGSRRSCLAKSTNLGCVPPSSITRSRESARKSSSFPERFSRPVLEGACVAATDAQKRILLWNQRAEKTFGWSKTEAQGEKFNQLLKVKFEHRIEELFSGKTREGRWRGEMLTRHKDDHAITLMSDWKVSADEQGNALFLLWYSDISELKRAQATIESQSLALRLLNTRLVTALDEERARIAREFHDQLGQALTAAKLNLYQASVLPQTGAAGRKLHKLLKQAISAVDGATALTQKLCTDLRPTMLDEASLEEAIRWQVRRIRWIKGWAKARLKLEVDPDLRISRAASEALFRILQESLTNIARHAKAEKIRVSLFRSENYAHLTIRDNGRGMNMRKISIGSSLGLLGMRERAAALGGDVEILSQPGRGTTVIARVPIEARDS